MQHSCVQLQAAVSAEVLHGNKTPDSRNLASDKNVMSTQFSAGSPYLTTKYPPPQPHPAASVCHGHHSVVLPPHISHAVPPPPRPPPSHWHTPMRMPGPWALKNFGGSGLENCCMNNSRSARSNNARGPQGPKVHPTLHLLTLSPLCKQVTRCLIEFVSDVLSYHHTANYCTLCLGCLMMVHF
jgi:hypothetical protein